MKMWRTGVIVLIASVRFVFAESEPKELRLAAGATASQAEWEKVHRPAILARMQEVMGPLPRHDRKRSLNVKIQEEVDCGEYVRRLITYEPEPQSTTTMKIFVVVNTLKFHHSKPGTRSS